MDVLLQGLQDIGHLMGMTSSAMIEGVKLNNIGNFIAAISNLTEALNALKSDTDYVLQKRGVKND
jgi:hypothetical protein